MNCVKCNAPLPDGAIFCPACGKKQVQEKRKALKRANGTGTVYKLSGRRRRPWVAAKNRVVIGYYEKKTDALEALEKLSGRDLTERYNMTFSEVYEAWKAEYCKRLSKAGQKAYETSYKAFSVLYSRKFRELRTADFQAVIDEHKSKTEAIKKYRQLISQMSKWAMREEINTQNFAQFVQLQSAPKKAKEIFTDADIEKIKKDGSEAARIILMLLATGMRIGELFFLPLEDYHETYVIGGSKTEAGRNRVIPIRPEGREHFSYFAKQATGPLLLSGYTGQKVYANYRNRDYYPLLDKLGIERKPPHATRHTYTSRAVKEGMPPEVLQKILGHADYSTTANVYTHLDIETLIKAVEGKGVADRLLTDEKSEKKKKP